MKERKRLDMLLLERGLIQSREKAQALIMEGKVYVSGTLVDKPGKLICSDSHVELKQEKRYVSRGGIKLEAAINAFGVDLVGKVAMDVGASTGGFTQCLLEHGAKRVYAIDVGYGLIALEFRNDARVILIERENIRYLKKEAIPELINFATVDVSFISLRLVLPRAKDFLAQNGEVIALIKPQFEVGKLEVGKGGIVRDPDKHQRVIKEIEMFAKDAGFISKGIIESPITGKDGNREFFIYLQNK